MVKLLRFAFLVCFVSFFALQFTFSQQTGVFTKTYTDRGITSSLYFWVPTDYDSTKTYPFIMGWHGAGDNGNNMRNILSYILVQRINGILVCPDANKINGQDGSFFSNLTGAAYSEVRQNYKIDTTKIVVMGFSWGGGFSYQIGLLNPQLFRGIIGHAPAIGSLTQDMWNNLKKVRMATILGDKDFNYTAVNSLMLNIKNQGGNLLYIIKPGVVHVDNAYFNSQAIIDDYRQCYNYVIDSQTDVEQSTLNFFDNELIVTPNPSNDIIRTTQDVTEPAEISDIFGSTVLRGKAGQQMFDISELPAGFYFIRSGTKIGRFLKI